MKKKAKETKSKTSRRARNPRAPHISDEISPSFVAHQDLGKEKTAKDSSSNLSVQSEPKEPVRARLIFGRLFQNLAYICLFLGVMAVLGVVVAAVLAYWPQNSPATPGSDQFMNNTNNGGWVWVLLAGSLPGFMLFLQIIVGVAIILFIIWGWRAAIRSARRLVVRITDEFLWSSVLVEPLMLSVAWLLAIIGAWWLAAPELFMPLAVWCGGFLILGLVCFWAMRRLAGSRLDLTRADLDLRR